MPLLFWTHIRRADLRANPHALFIFADNEARRGRGGQAEECRGEPNAVGVATKYAPKRRDFDYWSDADYERCVEVVNSDLEPIRHYLLAGGWVVASSAGIGTGMSELPERAPKIMQHIRESFRSLLVISKANPAISPPPKAVGQSASQPAAESQDQDDLFKAGSSANS